MDASGHFQLGSVSAAVLPAACSLRRSPPRPAALQQAGYHESFDHSTLFFDAFRVGGRLILSGPPLLNLSEWFAACRLYVDDVLIPRLEVRSMDRTQSVQMRLPGGGQGLGAKSVLRICSDDLELEVPISHDEIAPFAGRRVLTTLSKNNPPAWVREWAEFHVREHGTDAVLIYDNGSTDYEPGELLDALSAIKGLGEARVVNWPFPYGPGGGASAVWDSDFCQYGFLEHARARFLRSASGVINCDVDELVLRRADCDVYEAAARSGVGAVGLSGVWVDSVAEPPLSLDFPTFSRFRWINVTDAACTSKWALVPRMVPPAVQWGVHQLFGLDLAMSTEFSIRHFRGVTTGWKRSTRTAAGRTADHVPDEALISAIERASSQKS